MSKPITLGLNLERIYATILVTRDELERLKDSIRSLANDNIEIMDTILNDINDVQATIEGEYDTFHKLWKKAIVEFNSFMDDTEWNRTILPKYKDAYAEKLNLFLDKFNSIVQICEDFFNKFLEEKYESSTTKYKLDKNPYWSQRTDITQKSEEVRKSFSLPESAGFNWYSGKITDEYLQVKNEIIMINKFEHSKNVSLLDFVLKGNSITETLLFHPKYGMLNYISAGRERNTSGLVDHETQSPFLKLILKNSDEFNGQYNELKSKYLSKESKANLGDLNLNNDKMMPEYTGLLRHNTIDKLEVSPGDSYFIVKIRDNMPLKTDKPKNYHVSRTTVSGTGFTDNLENEFASEINTDNKESILSSYITTVKEKSDNSYPRKMDTLLVNIDKYGELIVDNNETIVSHFPIHLNYKKDVVDGDIIGASYGASFLNFQNEKVLKAAVYFKRKESDTESNILISEYNDIKNGNISYYKRGGFGKYTDEYDLFRNYVIKIRNIFNNKYIPIGQHKHLSGMLGDEDYLRYKSGTFFFLDYPYEILKDEIFGTMNIHKLNVNAEGYIKDFYSELVTKHLILGRDIAMNLNMKWEETFFKPTVFAYNEYFDVFGNPNRFDDVLAAPFLGSAVSGTDLQSISNVKKNYRTIYNLAYKYNDSVKSDIYTTNNTARSLLNNTSLTNSDVETVKESFYKELDTKLSKYNKLFLGTIIFIPYNPDNPDMIKGYAKAGSILSKTDYPEAYALFGDEYSNQYSGEIEEGKFALPNLNSRYLEYSNDTSKVNKFHTDKIPDLGYTVKFNDKDATGDIDMREGFLSENEETLSSLNLATGKSGGTDRKKIKVNYNSSATVTSGADFKLDFYIRVK